jgi:hypothetical protein
MARTRILPDAAPARPKTAHVRTPQPVTSPPNTAPEAMTQAEVIAQCEHAITACHAMREAANLWAHELDTAAVALEHTLKGLRAQAPRKAAVVRAVRQLERAL